MDGVVKTVAMCRDMVDCFLPDHGERARVFKGESEGSKQTIAVVGRGARVRPAKARRASIWNSSAAHLASFACLSISEVSMVRARSPIGRRRWAAEEGGG